LHLPRPNTWPLNSQGLGQFRPYCPCDPLRAAVWRVCHIPRTHVSSADRRERTACDCSAIARWWHYPFSSASSPSAMAHARNARAAPRALASPDISSRRRTTRSRLYGNRGPSYVRANSAASSRVRTVTSRTRRMGGWNTKSVMPRKLLFVDHKQARASPLHSGHTSISLLYHYYNTNITFVLSLYHSTVLSAVRPTSDRTNRRARQPWKRRHELG
jgi:hypothetical protein